MAEAAPESEKRREIAVLAEEAGGCVACPLASTRTKVVFGDGSPDSPLMLVGEGPGANEDATGIPFVGRAGQLLDECLRAAGMLRKHIYICNVVKCRASEIEEGRVRNRAPLPAEINACVPLWLEKQIAVIKPRVICCIGAPSANTIIHPNFRMTQERGRWFESKYCRNVIAALHPAFILRKQGQGDEYEKARQSLIDDLTDARDRARQAKNDPDMTLF
jgi:DNA polymerase